MSMDPRIHASLGVNPQLHQRMVPKLMMVNALLVLPLNQLLARIEQELSENPALELDEVPASADADWSGDEGGQSLTNWTPDDEEFDPFARMAAPVSLQEHLLMTLQAQGLSARDHAIGERLIGYINDNGYMEATAVQVAQDLGVTIPEVKDAHEFVKANCYPYPGERYRSEQDGGAVRPAEVARPDVIIRQTEEGFAVELCRQDAFALRVNAFYGDLRRQMRRAASGYSDKSRDHVRDYVGRAKSFIEVLARRNWTFASIVKTIVQTQWEFIQRGEAHMKPLTKAMIAAELGISESTVSRALDGKFAQLPSGRVVSFELFFDQSLPVKERIRALIAAETDPLTDEQMARLLTAEGTKIARRTVTKYREEMNVPPSTARGPLAEAK